MIIIFLLEVSALMLIGAIFTTQVFVPLFRGTPMFPYFRTGKLDRQLARRKEELEAEVLQEEVRQLEAKKDELYLRRFRNAQDQLVENLETIQGAPTRKQTNKN